LNSIYGKSYFFSNNDISEYDRNINFYSRSTDTLQNFKNSIFYHFKYNFFTKNVVKDDHISILIQNNYFEFLSDLYLAYLRNNVKIREEDFIKFYSENINKFECYTKLKLRIIHFDSLRDYFKFKRNSNKSNFTEKTVMLRIEDSLPFNFGIPDYVHKRLFYAQEDELYFRNFNNHYLSIVVGKFDCKKLTVDQSKKIIPKGVIVGDVLKKKLNQLKTMYKLNTNISSDTLFYQCINATNANDRVN